MCCPNHRDRKGKPTASARGSHVSILRRAFTLVELMVVLVILAMLSGVVN